MFLVKGRLLGALAGLAIAALGALHLSGQPAAECVNPAFAPTAAAATLADGR